MSLIRTRKVLSKRASRINARRARVPDGQLSASQLWHFINQFPPTLLHLWVGWKPDPIFQWFLTAFSPDASLAMASLARSASSIQHAHLSCSPSRSAEVLCEHAYLCCPDKGEIYLTFSRMICQEASPLPCLTCLFNLITAY